MEHVRNSAVGLFVTCPNKPLSRDLLEHVPNRPTALFGTCPNKPREAAYLDMSQTGPPLGSRRAAATPLRAAAPRCGQGAAWPRHLLPQLPTRGSTWATKSFTTEWPPRPAFRFALAGARARGRDRWGLGARGGGEGGPGAWARLFIAGSFLPTSLPMVLWCRKLPRRGASGAPGGEGWRRTSSPRGAGARLRGASAGLGGAGGRVQGDQSSRCNAAVAQGPRSRGR